MKMLKTHEPLLIAAEYGDDNYYVLPPKTVLYRDAVMPEGHVRYIAYFYHKGAIAHEEIPMKPEYGGHYYTPQWLYNINANTLKEIFGRFPLSKEDVATAVKANEITRDDLVDIIRSMP